MGSALGPAHLECGRSLNGSGHDSGLRGREDGGHILITVKMRYVCSWAMLCAMDMLIQCIYASVSAPGFTEDAIPALLDSVRANNARLEVSGMLLYIESSFFQVLEGPADTIDSLYEKIRVDPRHMRVTQIIREPIAQRKFPEWSMGFSALGREEAGELTGENDFFRDASCLQRLESGRAKKLLSAFRNGRWRADRTGSFRMSGA
jgi:hypothetical protein